jgi:hypothetical protein
MPVLNLLHELCLVSKEIQVAVVGLCFEYPFHHHLIFLLFRVYPDKGLGLRV